MNSTDALTYVAALAEYQQQAEALFNALKTHDEAAEWRFKWLHPRFCGMSVTDVMGVKHYSSALGHLSVALHQASASRLQLTKAAATVGDPGPSDGGGARKSQRCRRAVAQSLE